MSIGDEVGIETSLRRPCEPAPAPESATGLFEVSRSLISTGMWDGCWVVVLVDVDDERGCEAWAWPAPEVSMLLLLLAEVLIASGVEWMPMPADANWPGRFIGMVWGIWASATELQDWMQASNQ